MKTQSTKWAQILLAITLLVALLGLKPASAVRAEALTSPLLANGDFVWAKSMGGTAVDKANSSALDSNGNIYTTGYFKGTGDFDPGAGIVNLTNAGEADIFVSKLDSNGNFVWAKGWGGTGGDSGMDIVVDVSRNVYITGTFQGTVDFDPGANTFNLTSTGGRDIFISKLDSDGNFVWAKSMGGASDDYIHAISMDANANIYITGRFQGVVDFDPNTGIFNLTSAGSSDIFISKLDSSGNFVWAKSMGGTSFEVAYAISIDTNGNVYTTGIFQGTADFNPGADTFKVATSSFPSWIAAVTLSGPRA